MADAVGDALAEALRRMAYERAKLDLKERIYPNIRPQNDTLPALVYNLADSSPRITADSAGSLRRQVWRVVCYANRYADLEILGASAIRYLEDGDFRDDVYPGEPIAPVLHHIIALDSDDDYDDEVNVHVREIHLQVRAWT